MDRRVYILPVVSFFAVLVLFLRPDITGFMVAGPQKSEISAYISVSINQDGFVIEDSVVTIYLDDRKAEMAFGDFVSRTGTVYERVWAEVPETGYEGYGYGGTHAYSLDISEFGLDTVVERGVHELRIKVSYGDHVFSDTTEVIEV
jgi:hypothetical protein